MVKQIVTTTQHPYTRNNPTSNNQYNKNKDQQINKTADTTTKYNDKQSDKITNYWHSLTKQKLIPIRKTHTLPKKNPNNNNKHNLGKNIENKYRTNTKCTTKNSNDEIAMATVIPTPHTYTPQPKQFSSTNINHKKRKKIMTT